MFLQGFLKCKMSIDSKVILVVIKEHCEVLFKSLFNVKEIKLTHTEKEIKCTLLKTHQVKASICYISILNFLHLLKYTWIKK